MSAVESEIPSVIASAASGKGAALEGIPEGRRRRAARGALINSVFLVGIGTLSTGRAFVVAAFLTPAEYGVWSILFLAAALIGAIKAVAVSHKYVQQDEEDQEAAFQKAFGLELLSSGAMGLGMLLVAPLLVLLYDQDRLLAPGLALALMLPALAIETAPVAAFYRRMDYVRQRLVLGVDALVGFSITIGLAVMGAGYWSLVVGVIVGPWAGAAVALLICPYRLRPRYDRATARQYFSFSWPLMLAVTSTLLVAQLSIYAGDLALGLTGAGAIGLAATWAGYTDKLDSVITDTLYPAICRVRHRQDLLLEAFTKSNRLALMWGVPFGVALTLFAADLIEFGIGTQWVSVLGLLQVFGIVSAINHVGFNWTAFFRALNWTRPIAVVTVAGVGTTAIVAIPLLLIIGLDGFAWGIAVSTTVSFSVRWRYLTKLFPGFEIAKHAFRAAAPALLGAAVVVGLRLATEGERPLELAFGELFGYLVVVVFATAALERTLLREMISYLRSPRTEVGVA